MGKKTSAFSPPQQQKPVSPYFRIRRWGELPDCISRNPDIPPVFGVAKVTA
jgi:hypothetical protein